MPLAYACLIPRAGFYATTPVFVALYLLLLGERRPLVLVGVSLLVFALVSLVFVMLFYTALPTGTWPGFYELQQRLPGARPLSAGWSPSSTAQPLLLTDPTGLLIFMAGLLGGMFFGAIPGVNMLTLGAVILPFTALSRRDAGDHAALGDLLSPASMAAPSPRSSSTFPARPRTRPPASTAIR